MSREVVPLGQTFRRAYMYGTNDPQPQTGSSGNQPVLNIITNEGTEGHGLIPGGVSFTGRLLPANPPLPMHGVGEVGAYGGSAPRPPLPPAGGWSSNLPTQQPIINTYNNHQKLPNGHGSMLPALPDNIPYLHPQSPPGVPYGSNNLHYLPSFPISPNSIGHPQGGPPLSVDEFNVYLHTGLVPERPTTQQERISSSPQTTLHDGSPMSTSSANLPRMGHTNSAPYKQKAPEHAGGATRLAMRPVGHTSELGLHHLPPIKFNVLSQPLAYPNPLSPGYVQADIQNPFVNNGAVVSPEYGQPGWHPVASEFASTRGPTGGLCLPLATVGLPEDRSTSSSTRLQSSSQPSDREEEIRQGWIDLDRYCRCKDRTKKPLRHWEDQCPFNLNKRPPLYCDLPGCQNEVGFRTPYNLRRHQETASYHKAKE
ncbi:hypothetical protein M407DRAFT_222748 [Tulasnella calospora MUT 4182]|uniref:Uncharacterized protein n=1 Tax=Tulasnella calospora MUT 4182 TaxID=1051891 RepID=A0A0C3LDJ9_9AGAM|nr:hypothetical protein M407DRAFT_222748 [Tulasnella calospora MUT 4182]